MFNISELKKIIVDKYLGNGEATEYVNIFDWDW